MIIKYKSRPHNTKRKMHHSKRHTLKLNKLNKTKKYMHSNVKSNMGIYLQDEENDNQEKSTFNKKYEHSDKVNLILSNLENKKHKRKSRYGHSGIHYRNYRQGFN